MTLSWPAGQRLRTAWGAVALAGILAISARWIDRWRPPPPDHFTSVVFRVTTGADSGRGSLREAIFAADRASARARIVIGVPRVLLETPLPPLVNPFGTVLEAGRGGAEIEAAGVSGAVLDVASHGSVISDLRIHGGRAGVVVRARGAMLRGLSVAGSEAGVLIGDGAADASIVDAAFAENRIGVQIATATGRVTIRNSRFRDHVRAAVWAVGPAAAVSSPAETVILDNRFRNDATGVVVVNVAARIERNIFDDQYGAAVYASDARVALGDNRIRGGRSFGIFAERLSSGLVTGNEIAHNCAGGVLMRGVSNTRIVSNQIYQNGYGLVMMQDVAESPNTVADNLLADHVGDGIVLIAASPIVSRNRLLQNRLAGLRLSSMNVAAAVSVPAPLLTANVFQGNGWDAPLRDEFDTRSGTVTVNQPLTDCGWRLATPAIYAAQVGTAHQ